MDTKEVYKPHEFSKLVGVNVKTLQRWDNKGILKASRTPAGHRFYTHEQYLEYMRKSGGVDVQKEG